MNKALDVSNISMADKYILRLSSLSADTKLGIIEGLSASLRRKKAKEENSMEFVNKLSGAWNDGVSTEDKMKDIRKPEHSLLQRNVETW